MSDPTIHGVRPVFSANNALMALGDALSRIRHDDGLTWAEMGRVLGKSEDTAAKYADGSAEMGVVAYGLGKREWNGRFTGPFTRLCYDSRPTGLTDCAVNSTVIRASLAIAEAKQNGGQIYDWEIKACRPALEAARDAIEELLRRSA